MARVPVYQRQLSTAPISAPRIQPDIADTSGLTQGLNDATRAATQIALEERAKADTAALMSADQQLAEWKQQALFGTDGVYTRKGGQALDITGQTLPAFDQKVSELEEGLRTPAQRERWSIIKRNQREALSNELAKYEFGQREQYYDEVAEGQRQTAIQNAKLYAGEPGQVAYNLSKLQAVEGAEAQRKGLPAELAEQQRLASTSRLHTAVVDQLASRDPSQARTYFLENSLGMTGDDQLKVRTMLQPLVDRQVGTQAGVSAIGSSDAPSDRIFSSIIQAESAGRQFDAKGMPLTSQAGAVGVAQVMPATAPEAAKLAGLPWDQERFHHDADYNRALGQAYFTKQLNDFGSPLLAVAAYNAGPGKVQEWIKQYGDPRKGEISEAVFLDKIPYQETRDYVTNVLGQAARQHEPSFGEIAQAIDGRTDLTLTQKQYALSAAKDRLEWMKAEQKQRDDQNLEHAWSVVLQGQSYAAVPSQVWTALPAKARKDLMEYRPVTTSDPEVYYRARDLVVDGSEVNLLGMRGKLSDTDFKELTRLQQDRRQRGAEATAAIGTTDEMFKDALRTAGIDPNAKAGKQDAKKVASARRYVDTQIQALEQAAGKKATREQVQQVIDNAFIEGKVPGSGFLGFFSTTRHNFDRAPGEALNVTDIGQVPRLEKQQIVAALQRAGRKATDAEILRLFNEANQ